MRKINTINLVYVISFLDLLAIGLNIPLFTNHLRDLGISHTVIGLLNSTYSGIQVLSGPIIGAWSDVRSRRSVLITTLFICGICYGFLGVTYSVFYLFILRLILGTLKHTQSICKAVINDEVPLSEQTAVFGRSAAFGSLGFIVGPFIGGHLSEVEHGFAYVCALTSVLFIFNLGCAFLLPQESHKKKDTSNNVSIIKGMKNEITKTATELKSVDWAEHWDGFLLRFLFGLAVTCYFSNQSMYLKEKYGLSQKHIGYLISFFSTIGMFSALFLNIIDRIYKDDHTCFTRLFHFFSIITLCFAGISISPSLWMFLVLLIPIAVTSTVLRVVSMELMLKKSEKVHSGSLAGASNSIMSIARFVTPLLTGLISDVFSESFVMFVAVLPSFAGLALSFYRKRSVSNTVHIKNI